VAEVRLQIAHVCRGPIVSVDNVRYQPHLMEDGVVAASKWNGLDGSSSKVGWLQRFLITGLVLYLVRLS
jgi:hypothetical protein